MLCMILLLNRFLKNKFYIIIIKKSDKMIYYIYKSKIDNIDSIILIDRFKSDISKSEFFFYFLFFLLLFDFMYNILSI